MDAMADTHCVLVRVDLRPSTYQAFARVAKERRIDVGVLIASMADNAVKPGTRRHRSKGVPVNPDEVRRLNALGLSDNRIAREIGASQSTVSRVRNQLGLASPTPRPAGSGRRAA